MPSPSRPARPMSRLPPVAPGRGPARGAAGPVINTVNTMKLAGILMVVFAVLASLVGLSAAARGDSSDLPARLGSAFVVMVFGLGLVQGVNGVRVFLLVVAGLAIPGLLVLLALAKSAREVWMLVGAALLSATGYLLLLLEREAKRGLALTAASFVIIGSLAGLSAPLWLNSVARSTFSRELADAASSEGEYVHTGSGLWISPPADWVRVRSQSNFVAGTSANAAYANPKNHTITYLHVIEGRRPRRGSTGRAHQRSPRATPGQGCGRHGDTAGGHRGGGKPCPSVRDHVDRGRSRRSRGPSPHLPVEAASSP